MLSLRLPLFFASPICRQGGEWIALRHRRRHAHLYRRDHAARHLAELSVGLAWVYQLLAARLPCPIRQRART